jgi:hypothetical protein
MRAFLVVGGLYWALKSSSAGPSLFARVCLNPSLLAQVPILAFFNSYRDKLQDNGESAQRFLEKWGELMEGALGDCSSRVCVA